MRRTLTPPIIRQLVGRLGRLPSAHPGIFDGPEADSFETQRIERWLAQAARSDEDAAAIVVKIERKGFRPDRQAILAAARELEREFQIAIPPPPEDFRGRTYCPNCDNTGKKIEYRLCWTELTEDGPRKRARKVFNQVEGFEEMKSLKNATRADVYSVAVDCECRSVIAGGRR